MNTKISFIFFAVFTGASVSAQVGVNTTSPNATMDVSVQRTNANGTGAIINNNQIFGLLAPRVTRAELTANNSTVTYGANQIGALIYITDISAGDTSGTRTNVTAVGYYYFDGTLWQKFSGQISDLRLVGAANHITQDAGTGSSGTGVGTGTDNIAIGFAALNANTSGVHSIAIGTGALSGNTTGSNNTAIGYNAGTTVTTGGTNIMIGSGINVPASAGSNQMNIGNTVFGTGMTGTLAAPAGNIGINTSAPGNTLEIKSTTAATSGLRFTNLVNSPALATNASGDVIKAVANVANGAFWGLTGNSGTTAGTNFIGTTDNNDLIFKRFGVQAGWLSDGTVNGNTGFGTYSLPTTATGIFNSAVGSFGLSANTTGANNASVGAYTLTANTTGSNNAGMGVNALAANTTGSNNTAVGYQSLYLGNPVSFNSAFGVGALLNTTGNNNTAIGYHAGNALTSGSNNIAIGNSANLASATASNQMNIGSAVFGTGMTGSSAAPAGNIGILNTAPASTLDVKGSFAIPNATAVSANYALTIADNTLIVKGTGGTNVTLPDPTTCKGRIYTVINASTSSVNYTGFSVNDPVLGSARTTIPVAYVDALQSDGTQWVVVNPGSNNNIYNANGTLTANRVVSQAANTLAFTSTATTGTSHFTVDGTTLNIDEVNHRVGIGTATPSDKLNINTGTAGVSGLTLTQLGGGSFQQLGVDNNGIVGIYNPSSKQFITQSNGGFSLTGPTLYPNTSDIAELTTLDTTKWTVFSSMTKTLTVKATTSYVWENTNGGLTFYNNSGSTVTSLSFAIGLFVDNQLRSVKNIRNDGSYTTGSSNNLTFNFSGSVTGLSAGSHTFQIAILPRVGFVTNTTGYFGADGSANTGGFSEFQNRVVGYFTVVDQ